MENNKDVKNNIETNVDNDIENNNEENNYNSKDESEDLNKLLSALGEENDIENNTRNNYHSKIEAKKKKIKSLESILIIIFIVVTICALIFIEFIILSVIFADPPDQAAKPVIYLYPEKTTELTVKLGHKEKITCSYPEYTTGWNVIALPDGSLIDKNTGRKLYCLYWEGLYTEPVNLDEGFVVKGSDTIKFLEDKLAILGLNETEAEEFIIYWLPKLQKNKFNFIRFATMDEINKNMPLEFSVEPDTIIRVLMQYKALDDYIEVKEQNLFSPERKGFVAVEWGGSEIK